jgi:hypothetical protein
MQVLDVFGVQCHKQDLKKMSLVHSWISMCLLNLCTEMKSLPCPQYSQASLHLMHMQICGPTLFASGALLVLLPDSGEYY